MCDSLYVQGTTSQQKSSAPVKEEEEEDDDDDDDLDLFGSDDDEEAEKLKEQRLKAYAEKKAKKPTLIAKSSILLDVKPVSLRSLNMVYRSLKLQHSYLRLTDTFSPSHPVWSPAFVFSGMTKLTW